jgi:lycopene elongase/hydratase (dihydrobisanhydrobacterioruberin-forming)
MTVVLHARAGTPPLARLARPWFWPLGWGGAYLGSVLATHRLTPPTEAIPRSVDALIVLGPLIWTAVVTINDLNDLPSDRRNPRKANAPLVTGELTTTDLWHWHVVSAAAAPLVALLAGRAFAIGTVLALLLGYLYSVPPVRLKARPGFDVAVNAIAVGVLGPVAGWSLYRPVTDYPPAMAVFGLLLAAALYLPTTVIDRIADRDAGDVTSGVRWSARDCFRAGVGLWTAATVLWLIFYPYGLLFQLAAAPLVIGAYVALVRRPSIARMAVVTAVFAIPAGEFLRAYVSGS